MSLAGWVPPRRTIGWCAGKSGAALRTAKSDRARDTARRGAAGVVEGARFFFHSAKTGHKIDALRSCDKACFTVVDMDDVVADEFTTYFRSVICFGRVKILETPEEIVPAMRILADRYSPDEADEKKENEITKQLPALAVIELDVEHMTGKEAIELVRKRAKYE